MCKIKILILSFLILPTLNSFAADNVSSKLEDADTLYQNGNCEKAIPAYQTIPDSSLDQTQKDKVLFRISYCHFSLNHYDESENGFHKYLSTHPNEDEALLKYAQSLLYQDKYAPAEAVAMKIKSADFKADADIVIARTQIENSDYSQAIKLLKQYPNNAEAIYWIAVANYRNDMDEDAEKSFKLAIQKADENSWVHSDAKGWLNRIEQDKRKMHLRLTVGALKDSNLDQSGGSGTIGGQSGPGGPGGPPDPGTTKANYSNSNYTSDSGKYAAVDLIHNTYTSRKLNLVTTTSFSSPFYNNHSSYNQQQASIDFNLKATPTSTFNYGASAKYLDTFYDGKYSQDYVYVTPTASWSFAQNYWFKFSIPYTAYLKNKHIKIYGGSADLYYDPTNWLSVSVGGSSTKSSGPEALIRDFGSGPVLISGTMFTHYSSTGAYLGLTFYLGDSYQLGLTGSTYKTDYDLDKMPGTTKHQPRIDRLKSYQATFSKTFIQNILTASLSFSHASNKSEGFPGLISGGTVTNNTYTRNYTLLSLEYYY